MEVGTREAALILSKSERAVRAQLARGELAGTKRNGSWRVRLEDLPLTERARRDLLRRADEAHEAVEQALPRLVRRSRRARRLVEHEPFRLLTELHTSVSLDAPKRHVDRARLAIAVAFFEFDPRLRCAHLRRARRESAEALAELLAVGEDSADGEDSAGGAEVLEGQVLPRIGGLLRWNEERIGRPPARRGSRAEP